jgi:K+-transporting ATPase ATPase B chain
VILEEGHRAATVDESAITGESAPVIREAGGDRSAVTGGTRVLSDEIVVQVTANPGESFMDRMIGLIEGASRQKTPNEIALTILLAALTIIFLMVIITLKPFGAYAGVALVLVLAALLVCLIPTTIGGLLSAIGIAGMDRLVQKNVLAMSGRAAEAAGDVDVLLLDKTGTITLGNRQAVEFLPAPGVDVKELANVAQLASLADETPEGRSIVVLAKEYGLRGRDLQEFPQAHFVPFSANHMAASISTETASGKGPRGDPGFCRVVPAQKSGRRIEHRHWAAPWWWPAPAGSMAPFTSDIVKGGLPDRLALPGHGHPDRDDHRRQPPHRRGHRQGGGGG